MTLTVDTFISLAMANPLNAEITARLPDLGVAQCMLTAGCLFQAVWNHQANRPADQGVKDYDVFYFDPDLSYEAEDRVIRAAQGVFKDLGVNVEVRNQARVHLWYGQRFGRPYPQLHSARDGVDRYLVAGTCIALEVATGKLYAPYGLQDVAEGVLRINPLHTEPELFAQKALSYQARWPWLRIVAPGSAE
ncbi:nucleotidyltransferase family protein [Pseudomonas sp. EKM23D]|uniref:nucleotidyltransferase family protein n=1 Tax=Pseudomonas TaxID=286 RepID=UPI00142DE415|nr:MULTISPECIES: nucleotidyltransferase family protein [Pseudomonas]KAF6687580.1 nucleotidyltransferase family protein [Pseudomonas sp. EKM23D]QKJ74444.1 nucleotidyltransferase family protein [Pseudomonas rhodesiae]